MPHRWGKWASRTRRGTLGESKPKRQRCECSCAPSFDREQVWDTWARGHPYAGPAHTTVPFPQGSTLPFCIFVNFSRAESNSPRKPKAEPDHWPNFAIEECFSPVTAPGTSPTWRKGGQRSSSCKHFCTHHAEIRPQLQEASTNHLWISRCFLHCYALSTECL